MRKTDEEYLDNSRLRQIIKTYSDHIALPIVMTGDDGEETVNEASALWTRQKKNVTKEQYTEFYRHVGGFDEPWPTVHWHVEGKLNNASFICALDKTPRSF